MSITINRVIKGTLMQVSKSCNTFVFVLKMVSRRLCIITPVSFEDKRTLVMSNVCLQAFTNNGIR